MGEIAGDETFGFFRNPVASDFLESAAEGAGVVGVVVSYYGDIVFSGDTMGYPGGLVGIANFDEMRLFALDYFGNAIARYEEPVATRANKGERFHLIDAGIVFGTHGIAVRGDN